MSPTLLLAMVVAQPVPLEDDLKSPANRATALDRKIEALQSARQFREAVPLADEALALRRKLYPKAAFPDGHPDLAQSLHDLGSLLLRTRGDLAQAEPLLRQAVAMRRKLYPKDHFPDGQAKLAASLNNLGFLLSARGELAQVEPLHREAVDIRRKLYPKERFPDGHADLAESLNNLAFLLHKRGELAQAEPLYRETLAMLRTLYPKERFPDGHPVLIQSLNNLGTLLQHKGDLAQAELVLSEALTMQRKLYSEERFPIGHPHLALGLNNLASLVQDRGDLAQAEPLYREALAMRQRVFPEERFPAGHPDVAGSLNNLGSLLLARGELAQAEPLLRQALAMREKLYPKERFPAGHPDLPPNLTSLSVLLQARGDLEQAASLARVALDMQQRQTEALLAGSSEAQALTNLPQLTPARDWYLSVTRTLPAADKASYAGLWQSKGLLARWLAQRRLALARSGDAGLAELTAIRRELAALLLAPGAADRATRLQALSTRKEELEKELARRLPDFARALQDGRRQPDDLRRALPADAAFVDLLRYVRREHDPKQPKEGLQKTVCYLAFVLTPQQVRRVELGAAAPIDAAVAAWRRDLSSRKPDICDPKAERPEGALRRLVWAPLAKHLPAGTKTVWLAPDGALTGLPWAALPGSRPSTILLEEYALAVVPHGGVLLDGLTSKDAAAAPGAVLAVGGVEYGKAAQGKVAWPALPATAAERARVLSLAAEAQHAGLPLSGTEVTAAALLKGLPRARWVHLATHGFFADPWLRSLLQLDEKDYERSLRGERVGVGARSPLTLSGLVLSGGEVLTAEALAGLSLDGLELAVLSACDTGLGEVAGGEGVLGLQRALHVAGCRDVVASLWTVDDEATAALMSLFYHNLWRGKLAPIEALRQAQLTLYRHPERIPPLARERGPDFTKTVRLPPAATGETRAPARLWAGFILSGSGQ